MNILDIVYPRRCVGCKSVGQYLCNECRRMISRQAGSLRYRGVVRKILKEIKYRGSYDMVAEVVELWNPRISDQCAVYSQQVVTAVPMWEGKKRLRGFNQAELIAREVAKRWGVEYIELLERARETAPMYGLARWERAENVRGAFRINPKNQINQFTKLNIVLVDDVWTSGVTLTECVNTLREAGFKNVICLTLSR